MNISKNGKSDDNSWNHSKLWNSATNGHIEFKFMALETSGLWLLNLNILSAIGTKLHIFYLTHFIPYSVSYIMTVSYIK